MRQILFAALLILVAMAAACSPTTSQPHAFGSLSQDEFRQPLSEPALHKAAHAPSASTLVARIGASSMQSADFRIIGTQPTPRVQGQIGALVYHQDGKLATKEPALELQSSDAYPGQSPWNPDIDGRGNYIVIGSTVYERGSSLNEWHLSSTSAADASSYAYINPTSWSKSSGERILGEASVNGSRVWVLEATDAIGRHFKVWVRETDSYPLRYTTSYVNVKGATYYINALYLQFNGPARITAPPLSNRGIAPMGVPIQLNSGSVTVAEVAFDCSGTATRRPATTHKFVTITVAFNDTGPDPISITPYAWRLYGDETNGAIPVETGNPAALREQVVQPGARASGIVTFEVAEDAYQLLAVGKLPNVTAVFNVFLPIYPNGVSVCAESGG
jgi:hypothetical protein